MIPISPHEIPDLGITIVLPSDEPAWWESMWWDDIWTPEDAELDRAPYLIEARAA